MALAFRLAGAEVAYVHINQAKEQPRMLREYQILAIPGGFTYGDYIAAGRIMANELRFRLRAEVTRFIDDGKLVLGVCNGFQVLVKAGILPGLSGYFRAQTATLEFNDSHRFEDRWVYLRPVSHKCVFLSGIERVIQMPVAHAEGKFVTASAATLSKIKAGGLVAVRYVAPDGGKAEYPWNPNGSVEDIAGICDVTGRVFGLMPHPERFIVTTQHPRWTRQSVNAECGLRSDQTPDGLLVYQNAVNYARRNL
jgi:phosphoribosylformylglycinamidine synthase